MQKSVAMQELWKRFGWPSTQWSRLQMLRFREDECKLVSGAVKEAVQFAAQSAWFTDHVENGGNALRRRETHHSSGSMCAAEKMHQLQCSTILNDYERNQVCVTNADMLHAPRTLPKTAFKYDPKRIHSLGPKFDRLSLVRNPEWSATDYQGRNGGTLAFRSFVEAPGGYVDLLKSWRCILAVPKSIIYKTYEECERSTMNKKART